MEKRRRGVALQSHLSVVLLQKGTLMRVGDLAYQSSFGTGTTLLRGHS